MRGPEEAGWWASGLCAQTDPELFYPKESGGHAYAAKRVCARCPVKSECLEEALASNDQHGVRGGLTVPERRKIRRGAA